MLNWAAIWEGAHKGGIAGYALALALALRDRGHEVAAVASGRAYTQGPRGGLGPCEPRRHPAFFGVGVYEVVNSPVVAPSILQSRRPEQEVSAPALEAALGRIIEDFRPGVLHVQSLEGFSIGCVDAALARGVRVVYSLHNYHTLCPQVYFMRGHRHLCTDYDGGRRCRGCVQAPEPAEERRRLAAAQSQASPQASQPQPARPAAGGGRRWRLALPVLGGVGGLGGIGRRQPEPASHDAPHAGPDASASTGPAAPPPGLAGVPLDAPAGAIDPAADQRGVAEQLRQWRAPSAWLTPGDPTWRPFDNTPAAEPDVVGEPTAYARRRSAMVAMLNRCDAVLAVSRFVRDKYRAHGVRGDRLRTLRIGTIANDVVARHRELLFDPPPRPTPASRPLRLVFIGVNHWYKGLSMLADSLDLLTPEVLGLVELSVFAAGGESIEFRFRRMEPRLARLRLAHGYQPQDLAWMCGGQDVGVVPSVWWDNGPQTVLEMHACGLPVLGARAGGIEDLVRDGTDGLLFRANDRFALGAVLARCVRRPELVARLRQNVRPPKGMDAHAAELEPIYAGRVP